MTLAHRVAHLVIEGVDPERIAAGGGSAGGHVAAATGTAPNASRPALS